MKRSSDGHNKDSSMNEAGCIDEAVSQQAAHVTRMEGSASCYVNAALQATPGDHSGFFNPKMKLNRDLTICTLGAAVSQRALRFSDERLPPPQCLDAFAASGILGIRWALEAARGAELVIAINDADHYCSELMMQNCALNGLPVGKPGTQDSLKADAPQVEMHVSCRRADALLHEQCFDFIHLDPFGSCVPHLDSAVAQAPHKGVISLTATDTSALFGIYPDVTYRLYGARTSASQREYFREVGARLLLAAVARAAARHGRGVTPLLAVNAEHFLQVVVRVSKGARAADASLKQIMPLHSCPACGERGFAATGSVPCSCATSGAPSAPETAGPMWSGSLYDSDFLKDAAEAASTTKTLNKQVAPLLARLQEEAAAPALYYNVPKLCETGGGPPKLDTLVSVLRAKGYLASRTHFDPRSIRCSASLLQIKEAIASITGQA
ncbi:hypothetical protein CYMTET_26875 [Cymbomonas tetramitiformis]|uniref:tRNA (guanine(26)-N(2))-dimethyltransferase n=1 Tax=Cymbomonas tetramitiformis TaxID=36881 RepID=A0AAE0FSD2_9CHLO|nr:hypothetical protein CYMTET_26875 [Cymbomonas tetramitiformis]